MAAPGLEVLFATVQNQLRSNSDAVVCCLHWNIISSGFKCIGKGEEAPANVKNVRKSELLPPKWNESSDIYNLLYVSSDGKNDVHILKVVKMDTILLVHVMRVRDEKVGSMQITTTEYAGTDLSTFESALQNLGELEIRFKKEVIEELSASASTQQPTTSRESRNRPDPEGAYNDDDPLRVPPRHHQRQPPPDWGEPDDPFSIGRGDLDPLAGGRGGGMMFDPMRAGPRGRFDPSGGIPGRLPRGAVPPGARFDPFGPPVGPRGGPGHGPDPDHLPPPGYDDMFM